MREKTNTKEIEPRRGQRYGTAQPRGAALFEKMITIVNYAIFNASYIFSISEEGNQKQNKNKKAEIQAAVNKKLLN